MRGAIGSAFASVGSRTSSPPSSPETGTSCAIGVWRSHTVTVPPEFSQKRRFPIDQFIESRISLRKSPLERRIDEMLGTLEPGDRLLVSELSRLGRSLSQVIQIVETLVRRKIRFIAIKEAIRVAPRIVRIYTLRPFASHETAVELVLAVEEDVVPPDRADMGQ